MGWRALIATAHFLAAVLIALLWSPLLAVTYLLLVGLFYGWRNRARIMGRGRQKRLKFSPEGKYAVGIAIGVGIAAINTGNNLLYLFLGMILSLIVISGVLSEMTLRGLRVQRELPPRIFAGQAFLTTVRIRNTKRWLPSFSVQIEDLSDGLNRTKKCFFLKVRAGRSQHTSYRAEFARRGEYRFREIHLVTRFPFSFFVKRRIVSSKAIAMVYPRLFPLEHPPAPRAALGDEQAHLKKGGGLEFFGLRDYQAGDDARNIHWIRSAARDHEVVKEYASDSAPSTTVALLPRVAQAYSEDDSDQVASVDRCVDYAASLVAHFIGKNFDVEFLLPGEQWFVSADGQGLDALLRYLATLTFSPVDGSEQDWPSPPDFLVCHSSVSEGQAVPDTVQVICP